MSVSKTSPAVAAMQQATQKIRDLVAGGDNMRAKGTTYLPQFPMETPQAYKARKDSTWLFDGVGKALEDYVDRLFDKPIAPVDDGQLAEWCANIDMEGRDLSNFAQDAFTAAVRDGISFIMADAPRRPEGGVTRGQAQAMNLRPYLVNIELKDVLGWKVDASRNTAVLTQFRFMESVQPDDAGEFESDAVDQIRVLDLTEGRVAVRLFRQKANNAGEWQIHDEYLTDLTEIMVTPVYTMRTGFFTAKPPLARLAELNLAHWRSQSDQSNIMHYARVPMKVFIGWQDDELKDMISGPGYALVTSNDAAKAEVLEHSGASIQAGRDELKDLEQQMQWAGLQLVMAKSSGATATGDMIDEKKSTSSLARWADNLKDALEIALGWMVDIGGINADESVSMSRDFLSVTMNTADMDVLLKMGVSTETLLREAKRRGLLSEDLDIGEEIERMGSDPVLMA